MQTKLGVVSLREVGLSAFILAMMR
jgi:hypothetical protein